MTLKENLTLIQPNKINTIFSYREKQNIKFEKRHNFLGTNNFFDSFKTNYKTSISNSPSVTRFNHFNTTDSFSKKDKNFLTQNSINRIRDKITLSHIGNKTSYLNKNKKNLQFNNKTEFMPYPSIYKTLKPKKDLQAKQKMKIVEKSHSVNKKHSIFNYIKFEKQNNNEERETLFAKIFEDKDLKFNKKKKSNTEIKKKKSRKKIKETISQNNNKDSDSVTQDNNNFFNKITKDELSKGSENLSYFNNKYKINNKEGLKEVYTKKLNIHNTFLNFILNNVYRKIEISNERNKNLSYKLVKNLLINEIKNFQFKMNKIQKKYVIKNTKNDSCIEISKEDKILEDILKKLNFEIFGNFDLETLNKEKIGNKASSNLPPFANNVKLPVKFGINENEDILEIDDKLLNKIQNNEINENYFALTNTNDNNQKLIFNNNGVLVQNQSSNTTNNVEDNNNNNNENKIMNEQKLKYIQYIKYVQYLKLFESVCTDNNLNSKENIKLVFRNLKIVQNNLKALNIKEKEVQIYNKILNINSNENINTMYEKTLKKLNFFTEPYIFKDGKIIDKKDKTNKLEHQPKTNKEKNNKAKKVFKTASDLIKQISKDIETNFELYKLKKRGYNEAKLRRSLLSIPENAKKENKNVKKFKTLEDTEDNELNEIPEIIDEESNQKEIERRNYSRFNFKNKINKKNLNEKETNKKLTNINNNDTNNKNSKMKKKEENKENTTENNTLSKDKNKINGISTSTNPEDIIKSNIDNGEGKNVVDEDEEKDDYDELNEEEKMEYRKILAMKLKQSAFYKKFVRGDPDENKEILEKNESIDSESYTLDEDEVDGTNVNSNMNNLIKNTMLKKSKIRKKKKKNTSNNSNIYITNKNNENQINNRDNSIKRNINKILNNDNSQINIDNSKKNINIVTNSNNNKIINTDINTDVNSINDNEKDTHINTNNISTANKSIKTQSNNIKKNKIINKSKIVKFAIEENNNKKKDGNENIINKNPNNLYNNSQYISENEKSEFAKNIIVNQKLSNNNTFSLSNNNEKNQDSIKIINGVNAMDGLKNEDKENLIDHLISLKNIKEVKEKSPEQVEREQKEKKAIRKLVNKYLMDLLTQNLTLDWKKKKGGGLTKKERLEMYKRLGILYEYELFEMREEERKKILEKLETEDFGDLSYLNEKIKISLNNFMVQQEYLQQALAKNKNIRQKIFGKIKDDKLRQLIFDNSYLFNKINKERMYSDAEIEDILKSTFNAKNNQNEKDDTEYDSYYDYNGGYKFNYVKTKFVKKKRKQDIDFKNWNKSEQYDENDNNYDNDDDYENLLKKKKEEQERLKQELRDKKLYEFFSKIQKLKNDKTSNFESELDFLVNEQTGHKDLGKENNKTRIVNFIQDLELNRSRTEFNKKYLIRRLCFASPISFTTSNFYTDKAKNII